MKKQHLSKLQITLYILSALLFLYGAAIVSIIGLGYWFNAIGIIGGCVLALFTALLPWLKRQKVLLALILAAAGIFIVIAATFIGLELKQAAGTPKENAKWVLVLGAKVNPQGPSLEYRERLKAAASYAQDNPKCSILLTGGKGTNEHQTESEGGKEYLLSLGLEESRIFCETKSTTTEENLRYAAQVLQENGGSKEDDIVIVSSGFHLYRASLFAKEQGYTHASYLGSKGLSFLLPYYYFREFAAFVFDYLGL